MPTSRTPIHRRNGGGWLANGAKSYTCEGGASSPNGKPVHCVKRSVFAAFRGRQSRISVHSLEASSGAASVSNLASVLLRKSPSDNKSTHRHDSATIPASYDLPQVTRSPMSETMDGGKAGPLARRAAHLAQRPVGSFGVPLRVSRPLSVR